MPTATATAPSEKQVAFALRLADERDIPPLGETAEKRRQTLQQFLDQADLDRKALSWWIDRLMGYPEDRTGQAEPVEPGFYETAEGEVYVVKANRAGTRVYAKRLVEHGGERLTEDGEVVHLEFEYAPGVVQQLTGEQRMDLERARALSIRYGRCLACGKTLTDATSVERGVGPVCAKRFS